jgi:hypothetical protein
VDVYYDMLHPIRMQFFLYLKKILFKKSKHFAGQKHLAGQGYNTSEVSCFAANLSLS